MMQEPHDLREPSPSESERCLESSEDARDRAIVMELSEARQQVHEANLKLRHASRSRDEFLSAVSHELRTPLNVILGNSEMILGGMTGDLSPEALHSVQNIHTSGRELLERINQILELTQMKSRELDIEARVLPFHELMDEVLSRVTMEASGKDITIEMATDPDLNFIYGDETRLRQILIHLLSNAVKFTPTGMRVGLTGETMPDRDFLKLTVWDEGIGIDLEQQELLFEPFMQSETGLNRRYEGSGLGLPLVRGLVELHHGEIRIPDTSERGARVEIHLPWPLDAQRNLPPPEGISEGEINSPYLSPDRFQDTIGSIIEGPTGEECRARVLLAEDNPANQMIVRTFLGRHQYRVDVAVNGREAVEMAREECPDLILMDVQMPEMDGLEATRLLREWKPTRNTPIITLTGMAMSSDRNRCIEAGADHHVSKPFELADLLQLIQQCLEASATEQALPG